MKKQKIEQLAAKLEAVRLPTDRSKAVRGGHIIITEDIDAM